MSIEENKQLIRRLFQEVVNGGNIDVLDEVFIPGSMIVRSFKDTMGLMQSASCRAACRACRDACRGMSKPISTGSISGNMKFLRKS